VKKLKRLNEKEGTIRKWKGKNEPKSCSLKFANLDKEIELENISLDIKEIKYKEN
jgi:hypothetical protein